jgi:uncharacterized membrane protein (UPF0136 family)
MPNRARKLLLAAVSLICALLLGSYAFQISRDFVAAGLTAVLLNLAFAGSALFVVAVVLSFIRARLSAAAAILAVASGLPLYFDFAMPLLFRRIFYGEDAGTAWYWYLAGNPRAYLGLLTLAAAVVLAARELLAGRGRG